MPQLTSARRGCFRCRARAKESVVCYGLVLPDGSTWAMYSCRNHIAEMHRLSDQRLGDHNGLGRTFTTSSWGFPSTSMMGEPPNEDSRKARRFDYQVEETTMQKVVFETLTIVNDTVCEDCIHKLDKAFGAKL